MRTSEESKMMVRFQDQRRFIHVKPADSDDAVKQACFHIYNLDRTSGSRSFQIQFYLTEYQEFVDLETNEFEFRQLLALLASSEAPPTTDIRWRLRIIETTMNNTRFQSLPTATEDTYTYTYSFQQVNDGSRCTNEANAVGNESQPIPLVMTPPSSTNVSVVKKASLLVIPECDITQTSVNYRQPDVAPVPDEVPADLPAAVELYQLTFSRRLAPKQRSQYLTEIILRSPSNSKLRISGSLLTAEGQPGGGTANGNSSPVIHFEIPTNEYEGRWVLWVYVLTDEDANHVQYLHPSKGVFDHRADYHQISFVESSPLILNPFPIPLSLNEIRDQDYVLDMKICNQKPLSALKRRPLTSFPPVGSQIRNADDHATFLTQATSHRLKLSDERYHIGCILVKDETAVQRCISNVTLAPRQRKKNPTGKQEASTQKKRKRTTSKPRKFQRNQTREPTETQTDE